MSKECSFPTPPEDFMEIGFMCVDENGQLYKNVKTFDADAYEDGMNMNLLLDEFKYFLLGMGYSIDNVNKIQIVE